MPSRPRPWAVVPVAARAAVDEAPWSPGPGSGQLLCPSGASPPSHCPRLLARLPQGSDPSSVRVGPGGPAGLALCSPACPSRDPRLGGGKGHHGGAPAFPWLGGREGTAGLGWTGSGPGARLDCGLTNREAPLPPPRDEATTSRPEQGFPTPAETGAAAASPGLWLRASLFPGGVICIPGYSVFGFCSALSSGEPVLGVRFWSATRPGSPGSLGPRRAPGATAPTLAGPAHPTRLSKRRPAPAGRALSCRATGRGHLDVPL